MKPQIKNSADVYALLNAPLKDEVQESLIVITLNSGNGMIGQHWLCKGTDEQVHIPVKLVARQAVLDVACGVIIVHNHPSGYASPSKADVEQTSKLHAALRTLDISLQDHIIIGDGQYFSFSDDQLHFEQ